MENTKYDMNAKAKPEHVLELLDEFPAVKKYWMDFAESAGNKDDYERMILGFVVIDNKISHGPTLKESLEYLVKTTIENARKQNIEKEQIDKMLEEYRDNLD